MSSVARLSSNDPDLLATLNGTPRVDLPTNVQTALAAGRKTGSILREVIRLRRGPGRLTPQEYFYYRLWDDRMTRADKRRFVGKQAQQPMHFACNDTGWYATAADKLLWGTVMAGAGLPRPELLAITGPGRRVPTGRALASDAELTAFLRDPVHYPLFAKPIDGKYSISVISADGYDPSLDLVLLQGEPHAAPAALAHRLGDRAAGFLIQRRMEPDIGLRALFGPRLWSVRLTVLIRAGTPHIHRAVAKIAVGDNPADNFWRAGNMLGAIDLETGRVDRVVRGTGAAMTIDEPHPDTGAVIVGTTIPNWRRLTDLARQAACLLPAIRTQSWDIALTDGGPIPLEVNFGGDLNLSQLASGVGVLDETYREHLASCGYRC